MNKNGVTFGVLGLAIGLMLGFFGANYLNRNSVSSQTQPVAPNKVPTTAAPQTSGNPSKPLADVQKVLDKAKNEPKSAEAQIQAGEMYAKIERFDKAIEYYDRAQDLKPNDLATNVKLGNAYFDAKKFERAETVYAKAIELDPKNQGVRTDYGLTFYLREPSDTKRAIEEYRKSLAIDPKHELTLQNLAAALKDQGDEEELAKTLAKLKEVNPNNSTITKLKSDPK